MTKRRDPSSPHAMRPALALGLTALVWAALAGLARAEAGGGRPSDQDIFGGGPAATPAGSDGGAPPQVQADAGAAGTSNAGPRPLSRPLLPAPAGPPPSGEPAASTTPPAAAAEGTARDQALLGNGDGASQPFSDYVAPDNPLQIGGQVYLRAQTTAYQGSHPPPPASSQWTLTAPSLLDVYLDARPNPRVRAFVLGRMSFDPTRPPNGVSSAVPGIGNSGGQGAFVGTSTTGFTTFSTARGPTSILDQMWIGFDILEHVFVTVGKQHVRWGTGRFWQPTDYLHPLKRNPLDVFDARPGVSMLKLHVPWEEKGWNFYGFAVTEDPNTDTQTLAQVAGGARAEIVVLGAEIGLDALVKRGQPARGGIDVSTGIGDFDVYADVAIRSGKDFNVVERIAPDEVATCNLSGAPLPIPLTTAAASYGVTTLSGIKTQAVLGANWSRKYNDNDLFTVGAEYFYNQPGYANPSLYPGLLSNNTGTPLLNFFYTGQQYAALFASFPAPYSWNYTTFSLSTIGNLSDRSFVSRLDYSLTLLTHLSLEAFAAVHYGYRSGEFRLAIETPVAIGRSTDPATPLDCAAVPSFSTSPVLVDLGVALRLKI